MSDTFYTDKHITIYNSDCRDMSELADVSVQCVVTSPPYWGLRRYSGEQELIWGNKNCQHDWINTGIPKSGGVGDYEVGRVGNAKARSGSHEAKPSNVCSLCGAWKGAYGLEPNPEMYIKHTIEILREIRRVLRKDGCVFLNLGDSYFAGSGVQKKHGGKSYRHEYKDICRETGQDLGAIGQSDILKPKDLCLIPFRVAIAAQEDGWWVRSVIIWSKPNPMPESVTDRPTESHEYILMLTKNKTYYWDADAVREPISESYADDKRPHGVLRQRFYPNSKYVKAGMIEHDSSPFPSGERATGRNIRSVWEFPTQPYPEAHFAVFPEKLPEICIKAATPEAGCCSKCGAPWERIIEKREYPPEVFTKARRPDDSLVRSSPMADGKGSGGKMQKYIDEHPLKTLGWQPTCKCNADKVPSLVLDPFMGAGATLWVAKKLNRRAVGYEISEEYCRLAVNRNRQQGLL